MSELSERHPPLAVVENYLSQGVNGVLGIDGDPPAQLVIEATTSSIAVRVPFDGDEVDVAGYEKLSSDLVNDEGVEWQQLTVRLDDNIDDVYPILTGIADRVQLLREPFHVAVREILDALEAILRLKSRLSREQQVGMWGELLVLLSLSKAAGPATAIGAWRGAADEEHDFDLGPSDGEVKTTQGERRRHWISSSTQLAPTGHRPLYLISIQITAAGTGGGASLPQMIAATRGEFGGFGAQLEAQLTKLQYRDADAALYRTQWRLRSSVQFYLVDTAFPAITEATMNAMLPAAGRVVDLRYQIDLTGLPPCDPLVEIVELGDLPGGQDD